MRDFVDHLGVIRALIIRDMMVRFGRSHLGFIWTVLEPMILTAGVMLVWSLIHGATLHGVSVIAFVLTAYMPLTVWRHLTNPAIRILRNNGGMLYHFPVAPADIILGRLALEYLSTTAALAVVFFVIASVGLVKPPAEPGLMLLAWAMTGWFYAGQGMIIAALTEYWEPAERFIPPLNYLALPISGVFFMVDWLPSYAQKLLLLNPAVHCFEMFRAGLFGESVATYYDGYYLAAWSLGLSVVGMAAIYRVRDHIQIQ